MQNNNPKLDTLVSSSLIWWTGIIASEETWNKNIESKRWSNVDELPGWGSRYRVRIFGKHTSSKDVVPDDKLPLCEVMFPVTAGTGHAASWQSSNLRQGSIVIGFYKDGVKKNEPIIMGCIGTNDQTVLSKEQKTGFDAVTGFTDNITIPKYAITGQDPDSIKGEPANKESAVRESNTDSSPNEDTIADEVLVEEDKKALATSEVCNIVKLANVSVTVGNLIKGIEKNKTQFKSWKNAVNKNDFEEIQTLVTNAQTDISKGLKSLIGLVQPWIEEQISSKLREAFKKLNPSQQGPVEDIVDVAMQEIHCLFRRIIDQIFQTVGQFLANNIEKYVNIPLCAAENIVGTLVGNAVAVIEKGIQKGLEAVESIVGAIELGEEILGFIQNILEFSFCDGKTACPDLEEWDIWRGADFDPLNVPDPLRIITKAKDTVNSVKNLADFSEFENLKDDFDLSSIVQDNLETCNIGAIKCGPPQVQIFGGGGTEAAANAIIGAAGEILAVDITNFGFNYTDEPFIKIVDPCGRGTGAIAKIRTVKNIPASSGTGAIVTPFIGQNVITDADRIFGKDFNLNTFDENVLRNTVVQVTFSCTRDENSGSFFQFKIPDERRAARTVAGKRQFSISTADIKKNQTKQFTFKLAASKDYSVEAFISAGKEKLNIGPEEALGEGTKVSGSRGNLFNRERLRISLANKRIRIKNKLKRISRESNRSIRAGTTIALDDIARRKRGIQNRFKLQYTNLSSANSPILYKPEQVANHIEGTEDYEVTLKDGTKTSLKAEAEKFVKQKGNGRLVGRRLFFRDAGANNINGVLIITQLDDNPGAGRGFDGSFAEFTENGRNVFAVDPTRNTRFRISLIYKDGAEQEDRIFDKLTINKKQFDILNNTKNEINKKEGKKVIVEGLGVIERNFRIEGVGVDEKEIPSRDPDDIYDDLVITSDKGYFYFDKLSRKYFFKVDPTPEDLKSDAAEVLERGIISNDYSITADKTKVKRKGVVTFNISTADVDDGTEFYWIIREKRGTVSPSDFKDKNLYGKISVRNNSASFERKISNSASIGDAFVVTLSRSFTTELSEVKPSPKKLAESQIVTIVDEIISPDDPDRGQPNITDINTVGIGSTTFPLITPSDIDFPDIDVPDVPIITQDDILPEVTPIPDIPPGFDVTPLVTAGNIDFNDNIGVSLQDVIIIQAGSGYSPSFTGELGGLGRVWALPTDTISQTFDGGWNIPTPPDNYLCLSAGDIVTLPAGTTVITEPRNGKGGGETIIGGSEYVLQNDGCITTPDPRLPPPPTSRPPGISTITILPPPPPPPFSTDPIIIAPPVPDPPPPPEIPSNGEYEVDLCLEEIVILDPGFGYTKDDIVIINPSNGAKAEFTLGPFGTVESIRLLDRKVCGFTTRPEITIPSETGRNVKLIPKFSIDRIPLDTVNEPSGFEQYITVIDCVGRAPEQDFFRVPD